MLLGRRGRKEAMVQIKDWSHDQPTRKELEKIRGKDLKPVKTKAKWAFLKKAQGQ